MPYRIIGSSDHTRRLQQLIDSIAPADVSVLVTGESGCGKELVAQAIHERSERQYRPFIAVNCGAIPADLLESQLFGHKKGAFTGAIADHRGKLQEADTGTLFLDEIGDMPMSMQVKLLRVLQERNVTPIGSNQLIDIDIRVVAATHRNLEEEIAAGRFRADLFYRLNVLPLQVVPLRERRSEIPELIKHFAEGLKSVDRPITLAPGLSSLLQAYDWPGNVRELSNTVHRLSVLYPGQVLDLHNVDATMLPPGALDGLSTFPTPTERDGADAFDGLIESEQASDLAAQKFLQDHVDAETLQADDEFESIVMLAQGYEDFRAQGQSLKGMLSEIEQDLIARALEESGGNVSRCAKLLKMQRTTLIERIKKYELRVA
ncbi:MAG: sigma-54-dependent Fis family transcriptional regulator [Cellvibrionales bacterium]|nr:sigma-54-dependent Fis family transcriptional regulator [Cellvibrionales bacterium]